VTETKNSPAFSQIEKEFRPVRFTAVSVDDELKEGEPNLLVFDVFLDRDDRITNDQEMFGYEIFGVGTDGESRIRLLRLQPDLTFLSEEMVRDGDALKERQLTHCSSLSEDIRIRPDFEFRVYDDDEYIYRITEIVGLQMRRVAGNSGNQHR